MAKKEKGANQAMRWGRSRTGLVIFAIIILVIGIIFALWAWNRRVKEQAMTNVSLKAAPRSIKALPGVGQPTRAYESLVKEQNVKAVETAMKKQGSAAAVPTLTKTGYTPGSIKAAPIVAPAATNTGCDPKELDLARAAGVKVDELRCKGCNADQLHAAGYSAGELVLAGFTAKDLKGAGYTATESKEAGLGAKELLNEAGFSASELKSAGFSAADLKNAGADVKNLKLAGYTAAQLKAAGYTAADLKAAGTTLDELKSGGYGGAELKKAGFTALDMLQSGYAPEDMVSAGYTDGQIAEAGIPPAQIKVAKTRVAALQKLLKDCNPAAIAQAKNEGITAAEIKERFGISCPTSALKSAGFTVSDLRDAGFSPKDIIAAPFTPAEMKAGGFSAKQLKDIGYTANALKAAGFTIGDLKQATFTPSELAKAPFGANELREAGLTVEDLKGAGFKPDELKLAGFTDGDLLRGGFAPEEIGAASATMAATLKASRAPIAPPPRAPANPAERPAMIVPEERVRVPAAPSAAMAPPTAISPAVAAANPEAAFAAASAVSLTPQETRAEKAMAQIQKRNEKAMNAQQRDEQLKQIQQGMASQANDLFSTWNPPPTQQVVHGVAEAKPQTTGQSGELPPGAGMPSVISGPGGPSTLSPAAQAGSNTLKAGTILFAVLDTGINSDEQSPILATIVQQGALKNAKLLGQFSRVDKKLVLNFTTLSIPSQDKSISVNAVAIDPDTARTALASDVNNHYMLRYGTLFASSFLQGLAQAVSQSGSTVVFEPTGNTFITNPTTSTTQKGLIALGNVGTQYAATLGQNFQKPPTVTINSGAALGILLMADLTIPPS